MPLVMAKKKKQEELKLNRTYQRPVCAEDVNYWATTLSLKRK
jgi:hypothetical protein